MAFHTRSISLPSESHPLSVSVEDQLSRLRSGEATSSSSPSKICQNLCGLKNMYECVDGLLQLPHTQQDLYVGDVLDGSLRLLDICSTTKDVFSQMKGCVQKLESSIRRRNSRESNLKNEVENCIISRKKVNKMVLKCISNLKRIQKCKLPATMGILNEVEQVSLTIFESLLSFVCPPKARSMSSLVSKLVPVSPKGDEIDVALVALNKHHSMQGIELHNVQKDLQALELTIQKLEQELEYIFRCLIKNRVSFLNILNN